MTQSASIFQFAPSDPAGEQVEPWLNEDAVGRHFGVSTRTVRRWRLQGMPSRMLGGCRRFRLSEVERWHAERTAS